MLRDDLPEASSPKTTPGRGVLSGVGRLEFCRASGRGTVIQAAFASSPLRLLTPRNHGSAAWVFMASLGGGLVDGDRLSVDVRVDEGASALLGTQASTKVYRSAAQGLGSQQRLSLRVGPEAALTVIPDPVVCFAEARYEQSIDVDLAPTASLLLLDGYTCGRSARGERWAFSRYLSRTVISRCGSRALVEATQLETRHGPIAARMGRFDVVLSLIAIGPRFAPVREAMLAALPPAGVGDSVLVATSPVGSDGGIVRIAADRFEMASLSLRSSFRALAGVLGDDPFARKW